MEPEDLKTTLTDPGTGREEEVGHIGDSSGKCEQQVLGGQVGNTPNQGTDLALTWRMNALPLILKEGSMEGIHWVCRESEKLRECMPVASISSENLKWGSLQKWGEWGFTGGGGGLESSWVGIGTLGHWVMYRPSSCWRTWFPSDTHQHPCGMFSIFQAGDVKIECARTTRFWRRGDLKMNVKAQDSLWTKEAEERKKKKNCREWQQNGRDIYEVKEQLGGQGVPWDNDRKMKSEILVSDFWSRAVTGQDQSYSRGSWWLKLSRDLAHGCNEVSAEPQNVSYMSRAFIPISTRRTLKALLSVKDPILVYCHFKKFALLTCGWYMQKPPNRCKSNYPPIEINK